MLETTESPLAQKVCLRTVSADVYLRVIEEGRGSIVRVLKTLTYAHMGKKRSAVQVNSKNAVPFLQYICHILFLPHHNPIASLLL